MSLTLDEIAALPINRRPFPWSLRPLTTYSTDDWTSFDVLTQAGFDSKAVVLSAIKATCSFAYLEVWSRLVLENSKSFGLSVNLIPGLGIIDSLKPSPVIDGPWGLSLNGTLNGISPKTIGLPIPIGKVDLTSVTESKLTKAGKDLGVISDSLVLGFRNGLPYGIFNHPKVSKVTWSYNLLAYLIGTKFSGPWLGICNSLATFPNQLDQFGIPLGVDIPTVKSDLMGWLQFALLQLTEDVMKIVVGFEPTLVKTPNGYALIISQTPNIGFDPNGNIGIATSG